MVSWTNDAGTIIYHNGTLGKRPAYLVDSVCQINANTEQGKVCSYFSFLFLPYTMGIFSSRVYSIALGDLNRMNKFTDDLTLLASIGPSRCNDEG
jgi:hypothetical protein